MTVYCDTSFLVSYLNEDDVNHPAARAKAEGFSAHDFVVCEVHLLELPAAVRAAVKKMFRAARLAPLANVQHQVRPIDAAHLAVAV